MIAQRSKIIPPITAPSTAITQALATSFEAAALCIPEPPGRSPVGTAIALLPTPNVCAPMWYVCPFEVITLFAGADALVT